MFFVLLSLLSVNSSAYAQENNKDEPADQKYAVEIASVIVSKLAKGKKSIKAEKKSKPVVQ